MNITCTRNNVAQAMLTPISMRKIVVSIRVYGGGQPMRRIAGSGTHEYVRMQCAGQGEKACPKLTHVSR